MKTITKRIYYKFTMLFLFSLLVGCGGPRFTIITGTNVGLKVNSGDTTTRPPQFSLAYKRSELAIVPNGSSTAKEGTNADADTDTFSSLACFDFHTKWGGTTTVDQFIATGHAAQTLASGKTRENTQTGGTQTTGGN